MLNDRGEANEGNGGTGVQGNVQGLSVVVDCKDLAGDRGDAAAGWVIFQMAGQVRIDQGR